MVQIIQRAPSSGDRFAKAFAGASQAAAREIPEHYLKKEQMKVMEEQYAKENAAVQGLIGKDISGIRDPKVRQKFVEMALAAANDEQKGMSQFNRDSSLLGQKHQYSLEEGDQQSQNDLNRLSQLQEEKYGFETDLEGQKQGFKAEEAANKATQERNEKVIPFKNALKTIKKMREIGKRGRLGRFSGAKGFFGGKTAEDRGEYERLGKSLISFASNIPIRNKSEFETLAADLYDPSIPDSAREGILSAMEQIIMGNLQASSQDEMNGQNANENRQSLQEIFG